MSENSAESLTYHRDLTRDLSGKYAMVLAHLGPARSVLEIGCHSGYFSTVLMSYGYNVVGIEKNIEAVRQARLAGVNAVWGDAEQPLMLEPTDARFDAILLMDVLEHLYDPLALLQNLREHLTVNGRILITGPNVAYWAVRKDLLLGRWNYVNAGILDKTHLHFYTASSWRALIEAAGYSICRLQSAEGMIPWEHILVRLPVIRLMVPTFRQIGRSLFSTWTTIVYFVEAAPK